MTHREFRALFGEFSAPSWAGWNSIEDAIFGVEPEDAAFALRLSGRTTLPQRQVSEFWGIAGRGSGKSRFVARMAAYLAVGRVYRRVAGERVFIGVFAPSRSMAAVTFGYIRGLLHSVPMLEALIENETKDSIDLAPNITIEVITSNAAAPRSRAYGAAIVEEAAFLPDDDSAEPDIELLRALRPALARVPHSLLMVVSSPYAKSGELYRMWSERYGENDPDMLVIAADTATLNATFSQREIERAFRDDPVAAVSEYGRDGVISFRADVAGYISAAALAPVTPDVRELAPDPSRDAEGHFDAATGAETAKDAAVAAVAFGGVPAELAALRRWSPPFDPAVVVADAARLFRHYGLTRITIDRYAPNLVATLFRAHGIDCEICEHDTSANFAELLPAINAGRVRLLNDPDLLRELTRLERRPSVGGRDRIGHGRGGHDDVAAAAAAVLAAALKNADMPAVRLMFGAQWQAEQQVDDAPEPHSDDQRADEPAEAPAPELRTRREQEQQHSKQSEVERIARTQGVWFPWGHGR